MLCDWTLCNSRERILGEISGKPSDIISWFSTQGLRGSPRTLSGKNKINPPLPVPSPLGSEPLEVWKGSLPFALHTAQVYCKS